MPCRALERIRGLWRRRDWHSQVEDSLRDTLLELAVNSPLAVETDATVEGLEALALETALDSARFTSESAMTDVIEATGADAEEVCWWNVECSTTSS